MKFEELDLNDDLLDALYDMRFDTCTPIQEKCINPILEGRDLMGVAQTGTGKTAAYLLPILSKLADGGYPEDAINCIIMSPTRELAQQIDQAMQGFAYYLQGVSSVAVYGGNDGNRYDQEVKSLRLGADVVIATPGRFISHISMDNVDMSKVSFFVLDEADRMLDMGFSEDIMTIAKHLPPTCQTIMFSATMPDNIDALAKSLLKNPVEVKLAVSKPAEKIQQSAYVCYETQKLGIVKDIFKEDDLKRVIIFCGSKQKVKSVSASLQRKHVNCGEMHSDLDQAQRDEMMFRFKSGKIDVLVATDILARGIDIDDISMVINYDVPHDAEDYVHRIGRTARADKDGRAITLVSEEDQFWFQQIEKFLEKDITKNPVPQELGEAPEYKHAGKPSKNKTSAKSRRRKDRDTTAHKRKPNNRGRNNEPSENKEDGQQLKDGERRQRRNNNRGRQDNRQTPEGNVAEKPTSSAQRADNNKATGEAISGNEAQASRSNNDRRNNNRRRKRNGEVRGGNERQEKSVTETYMSRRRQDNNVHGGNDKGSNSKGGNAKNERSGRKKYQPVVQPANDKNPIKEFFKKPLRWLGFGKK